MTNPNKPISLRQRVRNLTAQLEKERAAFEASNARFLEDQARHLNRHDTDQAKISELYAAIKELSEGRPGSGVVVIK